MFGTMALALVTTVTPQSAADSLEALADARDALAAYYFEGWSGGVDADRGDTPSYWYFAAFQEVDPAARATLAGVTEELVRLAPRVGASSWLYRHRVALAVKNGELDRAAEIAAACASHAWWCLALRGYAAHLRRPGAGLPDFLAALEGMPTWQGCAWSDIGLLLPEDLREQFPQLACETLFPSEPDFERFWWMADPLWSREGNARRAEHLSRRVMQEIHFDILERYDSIMHDPGAAQRSEYVSRHRQEWGPWHGDREQAVRHFLSDWSVDQQVAMGFANDRSATVIGSDDPRTRIARFAVRGGYSFVPDLRRFHTPTESSAEDWAVTWDHGAERLHTRERWHNLSHQSVTLRRGEDLLVVAAAALPDAFADEEAPAAALVLGRPDDLTLTTAPARIDDGVFRASVRARTAGYVASLEVVGSETIGRARHGVPLPAGASGSGAEGVRTGAGVAGGAGTGGSGSGTGASGSRAGGSASPQVFAISDLALVDAAFGEGAMSLEDALLPSTTVPAGTSAGLYFEVYGVPAEEVVRVTLSGEEREDSSFFQRLWDSLGFGGPDDVLRVGWHESVDPQAADDDWVPRFMRLDLSALPPGDHEFTLTVARPGGEEATARKVVRVEGG